MLPSFIRPDNRVQDLNNRMYRRNIPSVTLQSVFDPRPFNTKYTAFPVFDKPSVSFPVDKLTPLQCLPEYKQEVQFNPGTSAPFNGFANNVDRESSLNNLFESNQRYAIQNKYIPSSSSDMYKMNIQPTYKNIKTHPLLNETYM